MIFVSALLLVIGFAGFLMAVSVWEVRSDLPFWKKVMGLILFSISGRSIRAGFEMISQLWVNFWS